MSKLGKLVLTLTLHVSCLWGCGGGDGGAVIIPSGSPPAKATATGVFVDGPVQGLAYVTSPGDIRGTTGPGGTYSHLPGDKVTFKIGDLVIGSAPASGIVTPFDLAKTARPQLSGAALTGAAIRIVQVLLTLNSNAKPDQALVINPSLQTLATGAHYRNIDILTTDLKQLVGDLTSRLLVDTAAASQHLTDTMVNLDKLADAGEYISLDATGNTALYVQVFYDGTVSGSGSNLLNYNQIFLVKGNITQPLSSVTDNFSLTVSDSSSGVAMASISGRSNGLGAITAKASDVSASATSDLALRRLDRSRAPYFGIYRGQYLDLVKNQAGVVSFGIDEAGNLFGWALPKNGNPAVDSYRVTGHVDSSGVISMAGLKSGSQLNYTGTFSTLANRHFSGNWTGTGAANGTFSADDINEPLFTIINPSGP